MVDKVSKNKFYLKDIPSCKGRNSLIRKSPNLYKGLITLFEIHICDCNFSLIDKNKLIKNLFAWFYKSPVVFNIDPVFKYGDKGRIVNGDFIHIGGPVKFIFLKKLFNILNLNIIDNKLIKRKKYSILFTLYIYDINSYNNNDIWLDINSNGFGYIKLFIVINAYYIQDIMQLIFYYYKNLLL